MVELSGYPAGEAIVVEEYKYGEHLNHELATLLSFAGLDREDLGEALGLPRLATLEQTIATLAAHCANFVAVRHFAVEKRFRLKGETDFQP